jgi:vacuolar iron transporter family protein
LLLEFLNILGNKMEDSLRTGLGFGLTSGIITTLGLIVGLNAGTASSVVVIAGILTIAIADSFSDALGIHISEEAEGIHDTEHIWKSTFYTWFFKLVVALSFLAPLIFFELETAIYFMIGWGVLLLSSFSYVLARWNKSSPLSTISEHLLVAGVVVVLAYYAGHFVSVLVG